MPETPSAAEPRRKYHSPMRTAAAISTRERILDAAAVCFADSGYVATTLRQIAEHAGVSVQSVHLAGPKPTLLTAAFRRRVESVELPQDLERLAPDDRRKLVVDFGVDLSARSAELWRAVDEASRSEPLVRAEYRELLAGSDDLLDALLPALDVTGPRREAVLTEIRFALSPAAYLHFVDHQEWSVEAYRSRCHDLVALLLRSA